MQNLFEEAGEVSKHKARLKAIHEKLDECLKALIEAKGISESGKLKYADLFQRLFVLMLVLEYFDRTSSKSTIYPRTTRWHFQLFCTEKKQVHKVNSS